MSAEEIDRLKAELHSINCRARAERNDEMRHALQRANLDLQRGELLVKIAEAYVALSRPSEQESVPAPAESPIQRHKRKPADTPSTPQMVTEALRHSEEGLGPTAIAKFIRLKWWPDVTAAEIGSVAWRMARDGRLEKNGSLYRLNGHAL